MFAAARCTQHAYRSYLDMFCMLVFSLFAQLQCFGPNIQLKVRKVNALDIILLPDLVQSSQY
jgi:hypothetical protein